MEIREIGGLSEYSVEIEFTSWPQEALEATHTHIKANEAIVTALVTQNGLALEHASEEMKGNLPIVTAAVQSLRKAYTSLEDNYWNGLLTKWGTSKDMRRKALAK